MTTKIIVEGFKAIGGRVEVGVRPLTLLAGANSSGKSSLMQAVLLLKQTLEANYDPGPLLLDGPNVRFTSANQFLHTEVGTQRVNGFTVGVEIGDHFAFETRLERTGPKSDLEVKQCRVKAKEFGEREFVSGMDLSDFVPPSSRLPKGAKAKVELSRERFWLLPVMQLEVPDGSAKQRLRMPVVPIDFAVFREVIHIPGLRGNPERSYPLTSTGPRFPGTFNNYTASLIARWIADKEQKIHELGQHLKRLGLTWKVDVKKVDDANIELRVARLVRAVQGGARDMVNIADVGFGVSQTLPVLVALLEARPGQLVYVEQPEIHLHPRAQVAMAGLLADAAKRGVLIVVETHSSLLLLAIQTLVAEGKLNSDLVKLHWFERDKQTGATQITSHDLDEAGRFGDWPEDFDDVSLLAQSQYLDAVTRAMKKG